ncbi:MAG: hypothetical protein KC496_10365 [Anaerolineae bacterium]|nr:hypothetical protein [Anaerolineae bacterium]
MANYEQVKKLLKDNYELAGFDVADEELESGDTILRYPEPGAFDVTLKLSRDDIQEYGELLQARAEFAAAPYPTSLCRKNFREQLLLSLDPRLDEDSLHDLFFQPAGAGEMYVEIDRVSLVYANFFRFEPGYMQLCIDRIFDVPERLRAAATDEPLDIRHTFARPLSMRVFKIGASSLEEAISVSSEWIESSLFTLAYEYDLPLLVAQDWPTSNATRREKLQRLSLQAQRVIMPDAGFRSDLVRLYQAGIASPIPTQQFLSFYQVLELFFQEVDHAGAYTALEELLGSPNFRADDAAIREIVRVVEAYKTQATSVDLLELLMRQYVPSEEIKAFIESSNSEAEETLHTLANRLYTLRNSIVNVGAGSPPVYTDSEIIKRNVPLVKFLAEKVILATGQG